MLNQITIQYRFLRFGPLISLYSILSCNYAYQFRCPVDFYIMNPTALNMQCIFHSVLSMTSPNYLGEHMRCPAHNFNLTWSSSSLGTE
jgi:hypothetical protein